MDYVVSSAGFHAAGPADLNALRFPGYTGGCSEVYRDVLYICI